MGAIITLGVLGIVVLYLGLFKAKNALIPVALLGLVVTLGFLVAGWSSEALPQLHGMVIFDRLALSFSMLCVAITGLVILLSKEYFKNISTYLSEYFSLIIFSLMSALLVNAYHNFAMLFIGIEVMSVALYVLIGSRKTDLATNEASLKYFLMGVYSTAFDLFCTTLL